MSSKLFALTVAGILIALSMNTIEAEPAGDAAPERVQTFSANRNAHNQIAQLEAEGF